MYAPYHQKTAYRTPNKIRKGYAQMRHIDIYLLSTFYKTKLHLTTDIVAQIVAHRTNLPVSSEDISNFLGRTLPKSKTLAKALHNEGLTAQQVADLMQTSVHNVRYYIKTAPKTPYINPYWKMKFEDAPYEPRPGVIIIK